MSMTGSEILAKIKFDLEVGALLGLSNEELMPRIIFDLRSKKGIDLAYLTYDKVCCVPDEPVAEPITADERAHLCSESEYALTATAIHRKHELLMEEEVSLEDFDPDLVEVIEPKETDDERMGLFDDGPVVPPIEPTGKPQPDFLQEDGLYLSLEKLAEHVKLPVATLNQKLKHAGLQEWVNGQFQLTEEGYHHALTDSEAMQSGSGNHYRWHLGTTCSVFGLTIE